MHMKKAVVLLSGGLDSTVTLAIAKSEGHDVHALSFDYGQRHARELESAKRIAEYYDVKEHRLIELDLSKFGGSALTDEFTPIPEARKLEHVGKDIPTTYVPARNTILLSVALGYAEVVGADSIFIGANALDYSGYPDCRPEYFKAFQKVAELGTKIGTEGKSIQIEHPLIDMTKADIVKKGHELKAPLHLTWSCYKGGEKACGKCDSCLLRLKGFKEAGIDDPIDYEVLS
jgi:7-cyano-7-deazaguanine synthase